MTQDSEAPSTIVDEGRIDAIIARLRELRAIKDGFDAEEANLKFELWPLVEPLGKAGHKSEIGTASVKTVRASYSYPKGSIDALINDWSQSPDQTLRNVAGILLRVRKDNKGYSYLEVKVK